MDLARHRRRLYVAMGATLVALVVAMAALAAAFVLHVGWALWLFGAAILSGFAAHGWLMLGFAHDASRGGATL
ncbi:MAG: hypothetical protein ACREEQ_13810 [Caulobacteraceae bacterium]